MKRFLGSMAVPLSLSAFASTAPAQDPPPEQRPRSMREIVMMPVVYRAPGMDRVKVHKDLEYTRANHPNLLMDIYTPPGSRRGERQPAVLFIHGGTGAENTPKDWGIYTSWGRLVAASGLVGVTFTHRLGFPKPLLAEAASDVSAALEYVRTMADSFGIDRDRICLAAYSAGGPLLSAAMQDKPGYVRCLVAFYAFLDIRKSDLHRANETPELVRTFSPITHLSGDTGRLPPIFVARAGLDEIPTMNDSIDRFIRKALAKNIAITVANHPRGVHGFDNQTDDGRSREIIRASLNFMRTHLGDAER